MVDQLPCHALGDQAWQQYSIAGLTRHLKAHNITSGFLEIVFLRNQKSIDLALFIKAAILANSIIEI